MTAQEFINQYGWKKAKDVLSKGLNMRSTYFDTKKHEFFDGTPVRKGVDVVLVSFLSDLKQLVDAWELVNRWDGVDAINELIVWEMEHHTNGGNGNKDLPDKKVIDRLKKAIELVEGVK